MMTEKYSKILGCLLGAAIGDAMGAPTETHTVPLVKERFGGFVYDYKQPLPNTLSFGQPTAFITDDFSLAYMHAQEIVKEGGVVTREGAQNALLRWSEYDQWSIPYAGPTTRRLIFKLKGLPFEKPKEYLLCDNAASTNGGGMKVSPVGLFNPGNVNKAIDDAITLCHVTHDNVIALAGACSIAASVARGMVKDATVMDVVEAGKYGATEGYRRASAIARPSAGPSIERRIDLAVEIGLKYGHDFEKVITEMSDIIGTGLAAAEAIPAAYGFLAAAGGDVMQTIFMSVNAGNDSDTVATMAGALSGVLGGAKKIPPHHLELLNRVNDIDIGKLAADIDRITGL
ncbi:MAG: ADP-ribosylglycohydrolase family protein [Christensenellales bacterium]